MLAALAIAAVLLVGLILIVLRLPQALWQGVLSGPWSALTAIGTILLASFALRTLRRQGEQSEAAQRPTVVIQRAELYVPKGLSAGEERASDLGTYHLRLEVVNMGPSPIYLTSARVGYYKIDIFYHELFRWLIQRPAAAGVSTTIETPINVHTGVPALPSNSVLRLHFLSGGSGVRVWRTELQDVRYGTGVYSFQPEYQLVPQEVRRRLADDSYLIE